MGVDIIFMWLAELFDQQFVNLLLATGLLFLVMFVTWWVYKKLSTRNIFHLFRSPRHPAPGFWDYAVYAMKYFLLFPALTFCGFLIFALSLFLLMRPVTWQLGWPCRRFPGATSTISMGKIITTWKQRL